MDGKIYMKISRGIENDILSGALRAGDQAPSTHQTAERFGVNAATAARGVAMLTAQGFLEKKRGVGLFVSETARDEIMSVRRERFRSGVLEEALEEARILGISKRDLIAMIMAL